MFYFSTMALCVAMSLFSVLVLKLYLDTFLHKAKGLRGISGWLPFFMWQCISETGCFPGNITLLFTFVTIAMVGLIVYAGPFWKRCVFSAVYLAIWMLLEGAVDFGIRYLSGTVKTEFLMISAPSKILLFLLSTGIRHFAKKKGIGKEPYDGGMGNDTVLYAVSAAAGPVREPIENWGMDACSCSCIDLPESFLLSCLHAVGQ